MKRKIILIIIVLISLVIVYYHEKLSAIYTDPLAFWNLFLSTTKIAQFSFYALTLNLVIFLSAAAIEIVSVGWAKSSLNRIISAPSKSTYGDIWCWALSILNLFDFFVLIFSFGFFYFISSIIMHNANSIDILSQINSPILGVTIVFILTDFKHYLWHYFMHKYPFWELHKYHHSAKELNIITSTRDHFLQKGILTIVDAFMFLLLGVPPEYFFIITFATQLYAYLLHSELNWSFGWIGKYILVSPKAHKIHHSQNKEHFGKNLGSIFIWWDLIFQTYFDTNDPITVGVKKSNFNKKGFWNDMIVGSQEFATAIIYPTKSR